VTGRTLRKRLHERRLLASTDDNRQVLTVRRTLAGVRKDVLHTTKDFLSTHTNQPDQPDHGGESLFTYADSVSPPWSGLNSGTRPAPEHEPDHEPKKGANGRVSAEPWSGNGREPDHEPDQQEAFVNAESRADGRVGQVFCTGEDENESSGARTRRVEGCI